MASFNLPRTDNEVILEVCRIIGSRDQSKSALLKPRGLPKARLMEGSGGWILPHISPTVLCRPWDMVRIKTGIYFAHFGLESGMVFEGTTGVYERIYRFSSK